MSDTPRTDANQNREFMAYDHLWSDFARSLERELAAMTRERDAMRACTSQMIERIEAKLNAQPGASA